MEKIISYKLNKHLSGIPQRELLIYADKFGTKITILNDDEIEDVIDLSFVPENHATTRWGQAGPDCMSVLEGVQQVA